MVGTSEELEVGNTKNCESVTNLSSSFILFLFPPFLFVYLVF